MFMGDVDGIGRDFEWLWALLVQLTVGFRPKVVEADAVDTAEATQGRGLALM